ncbi:MAG: HNH endonuclease [Devosia sp.]
MAQDPPGFVVSSEAQQTAWDHGFRVALGTSGAWLGFGSTTAPGEVWIAGAGAQGPWFLSVTHPGVASEMGGEMTPAEGIGRRAWIIENIAGLHAAVDRAYRLAVSLPDAPLEIFRAKTRELPRSTDAERLVVQRVGQDIFREALMDYWGGRCPLTGISDPALLRASHIVPWAECDSDAHRLDVHNGLLLSALWDAAFDRGLISFTDAGEAMFSPALSQAARVALDATRPGLLHGLTAHHLANLARHRMTFGFDRDEAGGPSV